MEGDDTVAAMTDEELASLALGLPETAEGSHFGTRDFRVRGKIFMTLRGPDFCVVKLTPDQQQMASAIMPRHVAAVPGSWGPERMDATFPSRCRKRGDQKALAPGLAKCGAEIYGFAGGLGIMSSSTVSGQSTT
ncbi:YjbR protein [Rhizobium sp. ERR 922]|nr:YjbR protein [Rhizobium sp. ERR 922]TWB97380.1 YjbR protein [Rhizobium sp. ERR 942]